MNIIKLTLISVLFFYSNLFAGEKETIESVDQLIKENTLRGEKVWPGFDLSEAPIMISFNNGHVYAFNLKSNNPAWKVITVGKDSKVLYTEKDYWGLSKTAMNPHLPIDGQVAYAFNLDQPGQTLEKLFEILVHERFHRYQFKHFPMEQYGGRYVDDFNVANLTLMQMEEMALAQFFQAAGHPELQKEYLLDFAAINQTRRAFIKDISVLWEDHQQAMEGLADYVSFKTFDELRVFKPYDGNKKLKEMLKLYAEDPNITERAVKWRHYGVGAAMGYALDFLKIEGWKSEIERGASMATLIDQAMNLTPDEINERMGSIEISYDYQAVHTQIGKTVAAYQKELKDLDTAYQKQEGIAIQIGRPRRASISGGGLTARTLYLANGSTISLQDTSLMTNIENNWRLELKDIPFVFQNHAGIREFKIDSACDVIIDGKSYKLTELFSSNATVPFEKIEVKGKSCQFKSEKNRGELSIYNGKVIISYY